MSGSRKKNPVVWWCDRSNKQSKQQCNKRFRRIVNQRLLSDYYVPHHVREVMDERVMAADGKHRLTPDSKNYKKCLRKK